ncbi:hypothetical protein [Thiomicrorhabdus sediminis]|uniref:Uncharacterized protein n=1 Tax=Thiomicrorhabdus sediminis TaxID=2580412 RepID=A0A4P9K649_9GAMM|nr:hypothetical protein [Thiomicrorhabdus sediminis]QCU90502.1 hypothetical protein FE785_07575 [Thiomicrorhabdus sediminis]
MAEADEKFDPNDLESIDALLDEAELEAADDLGGADAEDTVDSAVELESLDELDIGDAEVDMADSEELLDTLNDVPEVEEGVADVVPELSDSESEVVAVSEPQVEDEAPPLNTAVQANNATAQNNLAAQGNESSPQTKTAVDNTDDFLAKRASAQAAQNSNISADDMDSIKKLIVIFGSVLLVLALTGIGIGIWSALSASAAGMDEETKTLIEAIQVNSERNNALIGDSRKTVQEVEKKLDAINFQITQLNEDLTSLAQSSKPAEVIELPVADKTMNEQAAKTAEVAKVAPVAVQPNMTMAVDPEVTKKMALMNSKLIRAQRSLNEVNKRIKKMQSQYASIMHSVRIVEKQVLVEQKEKAEEAAKLKSQQQNNNYQYSAPDGGFYDQSVLDSYP